MTSSIACTSARRQPCGFLFVRSSKTIYVVEIPDGETLHRLIKNIRLLLISWQCLNNVSLGTSETKDFLTFRWIIFSCFGEFVKVFLKHPYLSHYGTQKFDAAFPRTLQKSLSWAKSIQFLVLKLISLRSFLTMSTDLHLAFLEDPFLWNYLLKFWKRSYFLPFWLHALPILIF